MKKNKLYVVIMNRFGDSWSHSYTLGVFDDYDLAIKNGSEEYVRRGGMMKYVPQIMEYEINKTIRESKIITKWEDGILVKLS